MDDLLPPADQLLASAIHYLIQGDEKDAALILLFCEAACLSELVPSSVLSKNRSDVAFHVFLVGPRAAYEAFNRWEQGFDDNLPFAAYPMRSAVISAFEAIAPPGSRCKGVDIRVQLIDIQPGWREELQEIAHGRRVHNQGVEIPGREIIEWGNLRFRSQSEIRIAKALDATRVLFLPNCLARLNKVNARLTKEADFLVCSHGKWGILEVDGPFHPRAAEDHERDRLFQQHGIKITQRFPAERCYDDAPDVVREFLTLLERNG